MKHAPEPRNTPLQPATSTPSARPRSSALPDFRLPPMQVSALTPYERDLRDAIGEAYDDIRDGRVLTESQMDQVFDELIDDARQRLEGGP